MKKLYTVFLLASVFILFNCGSTKNATNQPDSNSGADKIELPPNVASNKYSKKRQKY